jgi:Spy/CpxP family protein refolding chaperone
MRCAANQEISSMSDPIAPAKAGGTRRRWLTGVALATAFLAGGVTVSGISAVAQDGMQGMTSGGGHMDGHMQAMAHMTVALDAVGATADQKAKIEGILHAGLKPVMSLHSDMGDLHGALITLLTAPTIDRAALEQLRATEIGKLDQASKAAVQAMADAAEVLSPDQRAKLGAMIAEHQHHGA